MQQGAKVAGAFTNSIGMSFVAVQAGSFTMGDTAGGGYDNEKPTRQVSVAGFSMATTEVTQAQYQAVMGTNPSSFKGATLPVERVSWLDAVAFCNKLSQQEGLRPAYTINGTRVSLNSGTIGYRLPPEAEWEYAAKGGPQQQAQTVKYSGSTTLDEIAWYTSTTNYSGTKPVATKKPNALDLYDMSGNVWEWCWDWYGSYGSSANTDPTGPSSGSYRVDRGGGWCLSAIHARVSYRNYSTPGSRISDLGFRVVVPSVP